MALLLRMPEVATGASEAAIQSWLVSPGDPVAAGQAVAEIETEKAVIEYEAEEAGTFAGALVGAGESASVGTPIAVLALGTETPEQALATAGAGEDPSRGAIVPGGVDDAREAGSRTAEPAPAGAAGTAQHVSGSDGGATDSSAADRGAPGETARLFASPLVRRLAREHGLDLNVLTGTGPNGRIVRRDVEALIGATAPVPAESSAAEPQSQPLAVTGAAESAIDDGVRRVPHTGMRKAIARRLTESTSTVPHFYLVAHCRADELVALRRRVNEQADVKVSINDFVVKAAGAALRDVPEANAIWGEDAIERHDRVDIAVAVSVPGGLLTPVVRGVDTLSVGALSATIGELVNRAREGRLKQPELEGGTFSVSNLGMYGTEEFAAIINPPHAGILAVGGISRRPIVNQDDELDVASMMTVTLSADHRVVDGALAAQLLAAFQRRIENPLSLLV